VAGALVVEAEPRPNVEMKLADRRGTTAQRIGYQQLRERALHQCP